MDQELWEILLPTTDAVTGLHIQKSYHQVWDDKIRALTGGLTIHAVAQGQWVNKEDGNKLNRELMIPVRIACTRDQVNEILKITKEYYKQIQVMAFKISNEVIFYE
jgi:hypothetical protein